MSIFFASVTKKMEFSCRHYLQAALGIAENTEIDYLVSVYPNPVTNNLQIQTALQINSLEITDITGRLLFTSIAKTIDCSDFAKGVYFVKVKTEKGIAVKKFIKE